MYLNVVINPYPGDSMSPPLPIGAEVKLSTGDVGVFIWTGRVTVRVEGLIEPVQIDANLWRLPNRDVLFAKGDIEAGRSLFEFQLQCEPTDQSVLDFPKIDDVSVISTPISWEEMKRIMYHHPLGKDLIHLLLKAEGEPEYLQYMARAAQLHQRAQDLGWSNIRIYYAQNQLFEDYLRARNTRSE